VSAPLEQLGKRDPGRASRHNPPHRHQRYERDNPHHPRSVARWTVAISRAQLAFGPVFKPRQCNRGKLSKGFAIVSCEMSKI